MTHQWVALRGPVATVSTLCSVVRKGRLKSQGGAGARRGSRLTISSRLYFTCTSSAGVASVRHKVEGRVSGRTVHLAQAPSPPSLSLVSVCALFTTSPHLPATPYRVWGTEGDGGFVGRRGLEASFGFGVGRQPNRASVGRRTRVPCLRSGSDVPRCSSARAHPPDSTRCERSLVAEDARCSPSPGHRDRAKCCRRVATPLYVANKDTYPAVHGAPARHISRRAMIL